MEWAGYAMEHPVRAGQESRPYGGEYLPAGVGGTFGRVRADAAVLVVVSVL